MQKEQYDFLIRGLLAEDIQLLATTFCFPWSTFEVTLEKWRRYYEEQKDQLRTVCVIQKGDQLVGYGSLIYTPEYAHFKTSSIPEVSDVWIASHERKKGLGARLISFLEKVAKERGFTEVGIAVGLYGDYGQAQRLYCKLGYLPDGQGITYKGVSVVPGENYPVDDDLVLWLTKTL